MPWLSGRLRTPSDHANRPNNYHDVWWLEGWRLSQVAKLVGRRRLDSSSGCPSLSPPLPRTASAFDPLNGHAGLVGWLRLAFDHTNRTKPSPWHLVVQKFLAVVQVAPFLDTTPHNIAIPFVQATYHYPNTVTIHALAMIANFRWTSPFASHRMRLIFCPPPIARMGIFNGLVQWFARPNLLSVPERDSSAKRALWWLDGFTMIALSARFLVQLSSRTRYSHVRGSWYSNFLRMLVCSSRKYLCVSYGFCDRLLQTESTSFTPRIWRMLDRLWGD